MKKKLFISLFMVLGIGFNIQAGLIFRWVALAGAYCLGSKAIDASLDAYTFRDDPYHGLARTKKNEFKVASFLLPLFVNELRSPEQEELSKRRKKDSKQKLIDITTAAYDNYIVPGRSQQAAKGYEEATKYIFWLEGLEPESLPEWLRRKVWG